ncbi:hypothetical protein RIVERRIDER_15 [Xanthomonas phage RiverRider]|uniref:Uncharacterized protein n=1 Tax=Xanthomonas phage RiverRider TaxID=2108116 RepID=A0A2P1JUV0_9CAUD|nr:hypothetical protein HWB58_gp15 [Xanthomonas phage RiverRider]AVO23103.1 hypothetical protein RIVERRIDER_15 [Xanthomonas phage RiverRider]
MSREKCFVFGSNEGGIHGAGAAQAAYRKHGARWGYGYGLQGTSFAIPTKEAIGGTVGKTLPLERINQYVQGFLAFAAGRPDLQFQVTRIGCGLAGLTDSQIAPMFKGAPSNVLFDDAWRYLLGDKYHYWGTFDA